MKIILLLTLFSWNLWAESAEDDAMRMSEIVSPKISDDQWKNLVKSKLHESYDVQQGDTLWGISKIMFGNSFVWPKLWTINTNTIGNPHVLEPGYLLTFDPEVGQPVMVTPLDTGKQESAPEYKNTSANKFQTDLPPPGKNIGTVAVVGKFGFEGTPKKFVLDHFLAEPKDITGMRISSSNSENMYINIGEAIQGLSKFLPKTNQMSVARMIKDVSKSNKRLFKIIGKVSVAHTSNDAYFGKLVSSTEPVQRGDYLFPIDVADINVPNVPMMEGVKAKIIDTIEGGKNLIGKNSFVILNQGTDKGMRVGGTMTIYGLDSHNDEAPFIYKRGNLKLVRVYDRESIGFITNLDRVYEIDDLMAQSTGYNSSNPVLGAPVAEPAPEDIQNVQEGFGNPDKELPTSEEDNMLLDPDGSKKDQLPSIDQDLEKLDEKSLQENELKELDKKGTKEKVEKLTDPSFGEQSKGAAEAPPSTTVPNMDPDAFEQLTPEEEKLLDSETGAKK